MKIEIIIIIIIFIYVIYVSNFYERVKTINYKIENKKVIDNIYNKLLYQKKFLQNTSKNTQHMWNENIDESIKKDIKKINNDIIGKIGYEYEYIPEMTEIYWSSKGNNNSDKQYVSTHMDGPFYYCDLYRALITINGNKNINTVFTYEKLDKNLEKYDISLFDYNKTPHYIYVNKNENDNTQRIILKLHYTKNPFKNHCKSVHCKFGRQTRNLFERNKKNLYIEGIISRTSLYYHTFRNYILFFVFLLIIYNLYNKHSKTIYLLYLFVFIEICIILYILHFNFINYKECPNYYS